MLQDVLTEAEAGVHLFGEHVKVTVTPASNSTEEREQNDSEEASSVDTAQTQEPAKPKGWTQKKTATDWGGVRQHDYSEQREREREREREHPKSGLICDL